MVSRFLRSFVRSSSSTSAQQPHLQWLYLTYPSRFSLHRPDIAWHVTLSLSRLLYALKFSVVFFQFILRRSLSFSLSVFFCEEKKKEREPVRLYKSHGIDRDSSVFK